MAAQIAEIALNLTGLLNFILHIFLRANADRLAIRGAETPWSDKRSMRIFGPSDLNIREHISSPMLWQAKDHDKNPIIVQNLEESSIEWSIQSDHDSYSAQGPLQHAVFPSPKERRPLMPPMKMSPRLSLTSNSSAYSIFPTSTLARQLHMSASTTFTNINEELEIPLPPQPLFAPKHDRTDSQQSRQSSATVQIGLRLSYENHALDPLDTSQPSSLPMPPQPTYAALTRQKLQRASASSEAVNDYAALLAQTYEESGVQRWRSMSSHGEHVNHIAAETPIPQQETLALRTETLSFAAFQRPPKQAIFQFTCTRPHIAANTRDMQQRAVNPTSIAVGLPSSPKAVASWRPQNWNMAKQGGRPNVSPIEGVKEDERRGRKGSGTTDKELPMVPESAQPDVSPLSMNNPWNLSESQVIQRPSGWV